MVVEAATTVASPASSTSATCAPRVDDLAVAAAYQVGEAAIRSPTSCTCRGLSRGAPLAPTELDVLFDDHAPVLMVVAISGWRAARIRQRGYLLRNDPAAWRLRPHRHPRATAGAFRSA